MKAITACVMLAWPAVSLADDETDLLKKNVSFNGEEFTIAEMFEYLGQTLKPAPNVVLKGNVGSQQVSRLVVKDVPLGNLFKVMESVRNVRIEIIDQGGEGRPADPFGGAPPSKRKLSGAGVVVVSSTLKEAFDDPFGCGGGMPKLKNLAPPEKMETEVISLAKLEMPVEALVEAIKLTWKGVDPKLEQRANLVFHEPSKLLIVTGPKTAIELTKKTVAAVLPDYREKSAQGNALPMIKVVPQPGKLYKPTPAKPKTQTDALPKTDLEPLVPLQPRPRPAKPAQDPFGP
ncbi:MAG: hypothetical protein ACON38_10645 [Akkermansiaceae bacterium]